MDQPINPFAGVPRGRLLEGSEKIAGYIWNDPKRWRAVAHLDRAEWGLMNLRGKLVGFTGWIDHALERRIGKKRRRGARHIEDHQTAA